MKLLINIPDEKYNDILHTHINMRGIADNAIAMGTPIPDNATNEEIDEFIAFGHEFNFAPDEWWDERE